MTAWAPASLRRETDTSPVNAPFSSQCTFCAPKIIGMSRSFKKSEQGTRRVEGGQMTKKRESYMCGDSLSAETRPCKRARLFSREPCIFQFATIIKGLFSRE